MTRRRFLEVASAAWLHHAMPVVAHAATGIAAATSPGDPTRTRDASEPTTVLLCGDVMTGRGIDQILPHPGSATLYERYARSAMLYVERAERASGSIARPLSFRYVWEDLLPLVERSRPAARIANLETAVTASEAAWPGKPIHYRMHPANIGCLTAARFDCCVLANNHVLDWGYPGLEETLATLHRAGIRTAGAGRDLASAQSPAAITLPDGRRLLVFAYGMGTAGVPLEWAAGRHRPGLARLPDLSAESLTRIAAGIREHRLSGDLVILSIHWGGNWGYAVSADEQRFARQLVDVAGADIVHGHSSHHPKGIEVYRERLILYGCGDLLNDYEGIGGYDAYRGELGLVYLPSLHADGRLARLVLIPTRIRRLSARRATGADSDWLVAMLDREGRNFGTSILRIPDGTLQLRWR